MTVQNVKISRSFFERQAKVFWFFERLAFNTGKRVSQGKSTIFETAVAIALAPNGFKFFRKPRHSSQKTEKAGERVYIFEGRLIDR